MNYVAAALALTLSVPLLAQSFDFNADGKTDILWRNTVTGGNVVWYMANGSIIGGRALVTNPPDWQIVGTADFNSDGNFDMQFFHPASRRLLLWYLDANQIKTSFAWIDIVTPDFDHQVDGLVPRWIRDFTLDGKPDILWSYPNAVGSPVLWVMNGTQFVEAQHGGGTMAGHGPMGEWLNDARPDRIFCDELPCSGPRVLLLPGGGGCCYSTLGDVPPPWSIVGAGHFNDDSVMDLIIQHAGTRLVKICHLATGIDDGYDTDPDIDVAGCTSIYYRPSAEWVVVGPR